ncbi:MAG: 2-amino-4-hydroxy-6-hydroxymethyldihydropteridine diphosphokinase [Acidobacteria bacterium]|nr:MAG: 2-amino-4-hydroxy-6-hydroxymethyldihydropteridine diphosphokinase [Acidobacteriota bacterium]
MKTVYLSLGSNLGDRAAHLEEAIRRLPDVGVVVRRVSSFYKTEPVEVRSQPWFVNCVVEAATELMPTRLLGALKSLERTLGRQPGTPKGPRPIDIDILLYENVVVQSPELEIPHSRLAERRFVLAPLTELAPEARHPVTERTVLEMLHETPDASAVVRMKDCRE